MRKYRTVLIAALLILVCGGSAFAHASRDWKNRLDAHTAKLWVDAQFLGDIVLNARAEMDIVWLPKSLLRVLEQDNDVYEWVSKALSYHYANKKDGRPDVKGRDIFVLNYRVRKVWNFDPADIVINGYKIKPEDIFTDKSLRVAGELANGDEGSLAVCVPALKPGSVVEISLGTDKINFEVPKK